MVKKYKIIRSKKAVVLAEFALSIPILLGFMFFIIEFGNVFYLTNSVNNIVCNAARYAAIYPNATETILKDKAGASDALDNPALLTLSVTPVPGATRTIGDPIIVTATYSYTPTFNPLILFSATDTWNPNITGTAVSRVEITNE